jgi:nitrile hydratase accessory protein
MRHESEHVSLPTSLRASLNDLPGIPMDADSPVFNEPWEARAFAMTLALHERGVFTWPQWAAALSREIDRARAAGDADLGDTYYRHWLRALESLVSAL